MMLALLLAISISSPRIGTFFNLNGMVPSFVPADRTFGSDDATNFTHRLDPKEQAAVNAVFEAYFERVYYGYAGLSNVWSVTDYGPECTGGTGLDRFRFYPQASDGRSSFHYDPDTNRSVRTRRLVEYDNLRNLCSELYSGWPGGFDGGPDDFLKIYRPLWTRTDKYGNNLSPVWASSLFDGLNIEHGQPETEFPVIGWCDKRTFLCRGSGGGGKDPYYWANLTLGWRNLALGEDDAVNWASSTPEYSCVVEDMMWDVQFGDPPHGNYMRYEGYLPESYALTNTTMDVVGRGYAVTNVTQDLAHSGDYPFSLGSRVTSPATYRLRDAIRSTLEYHFYVLGVTNCPFTGVMSLDVDLSSMRCERLSPGRYGITVYPSFVCSVESPEYSGELDFYEEFTFDLVVGSPPPGFDFEQDPYLNNEKFEDVLQFTFSGRTDGDANVIGDLSFSVGDADAIASASFDYVRNFTNVTHFAGLEGITNTTRRLVSDNFAGLGLGLSALDRSYCEVSHAIPTVVSNFIASAGRTYSAVLPVGTVSLSWDSSRGGWSQTIDEVDVPRLEEDSERSSVTNVEATAYEDFCVYANPARLSTSLGSFVTPGAQDVVRWESNSDLVRVFGDVVLRLVPDDGEVMVDIGGFFIDSNGNVTFECFAIGSSGGGVDPVYDYFEIPIGPPQTAYSNVSVSVTFSASTGYEFGGTFKTAQLDRRTGLMPYPGDFSRVDTSARPVLWTVFGRGFKGGYDKDNEFAMRSGALMREIRYETSTRLNQAFDYSCGSGVFSSAQTAFSVADSHYASLASSCRQKFASAAGFDFGDPLSLLDFVSSGIGDALSHVVFSGVLGLSLTPLCGASAIGPGRVVLARITFEVRGGAVSVGAARCIDYDAGEYVDGTPPYDVYSSGVSLMEDNTKVKEGHEPANHDFHGGAVAGRMTSLSKVNWDWKALKRERNNQ